MRIAIYSRKSLETDTGESIQNQIKMCKEYFSRQYTDCTFEVFEDEGYSGGNIKRPDFQRMMTLVKMKQFDIIAVYKVDRIARNIIDFVNIYAEMERYNVQLVSITEGFDPSTPSGKMMMLLMASFAKMERMNIAQRVKDNMKELAKLGRWSGSTAPSGYVVKTIKVNDKKNVFLEINEEEAPVIREMFIKYAEGYSSTEISSYLESKGYIYKSPTVIEILKNPTYLKSSPESIKYLESIGYTVYGESNWCGFLPYNRRPRNKGVKSYNDKNKLVGVSKHKPIVDLDLWLQVQEKLKEKGMAPRPRESNFTFLSGGIVKCRCGATMEVCVGRKRQDGSRLYYFRCVDACGNTALRVDEGEKYIDNFMLKLTDKNVLKFMIIKDKPVVDVEKEIKSINKKISQNNTAINNLIDKLAMMSNDAAKLLTDKIEQLSKQNNTFREQLLGIEREKLFQQRDNDNIDVLHNQVLFFVKAENIDDKRRLVKIIIENIFWDAESRSIEIKLVSES